jgi:hypothetical protein
LASPEDVFDDFDSGESINLLQYERGPTPCPSGLQLQLSARRAARRELWWFYTRMRGRVPAVGEAPPRTVAAASRIAGRLSDLLPEHRGAFVVRYARRLWPVRLIRRFGGLTSIVVRFAAMRRQRGPGETLAQAEEAVVTELLADIAAAGRPLDPTQREGVVIDRAKTLRRLQRAAQNYVRSAELAYFAARGGGPCIVPLRSREGA